MPLRYHDLEKIQYFSVEKNYAVHNVVNNSRSGIITCNYRQLTVM